MIARAIDNDECVMVCSIDLSSAFDLVNIALLLKRLKIIGWKNMPGMESSLHDSIFGYSIVWIIMAAT